MAKPDYRGGSIVNLMASLITGLGGVESLYPPLKLLPPEEVARFRKVVLLVIDGLGYDYMQGSGGVGVLRSLRKRSNDAVTSPTRASLIAKDWRRTVPSSAGA